MAEQEVHVIEDRVGLGEIAVSQERQVHAGDIDGVDAGDDRDRRWGAGPVGLVQPARGPDGSVGRREIERRPLRDLGIEDRQVAKQVDVEVRGGEEHLAEADPGGRRRLGGDALDGASRPRLPMLCAITWTREAPLSVAKRTRKSVIADSLASMLAASAA